jgi:DNA-binding CsgD family transcriptional regulator
MAEDSTGVVAPRRQAHTAGVVPTAGSRFIGREAELERLAHARSLAAGGQPTAVLIGGEAGIGKSRLVAEFLAQLGHAGGSSVAGSCVAGHDGGIPYAPWIEIVRRLSVEQAVPGDAAGAALSWLVTGPSDPGGAGRPAGDARALLFEAVRTMVATAGAASAPLVVVIEDLHWADESTRDLLAFVVANLVTDPVLLVLTYRSDDLALGHPRRGYLAELVRRSGGDRMELARFTHAEVGEKVADICGGIGPGGLLESVWERSEGNPFFAEELLASAWRADVDLPVTLRDTLVSRLGTVSGPAQRILRVVAAGGERVPHRLLATAVPGKELEDALREAADHQLVVLGGADESWSFRHALLREVAYGQLLPDERARAHAAFARALAESVPGDVHHGRVPADLARHWLAAGETGPALAASVAAAAAAERVFAYAEATAHYETAIRLWTGVADATEQAGMTHAGVLTRAAGTAHLAGEHLRAAELVREAIDAVRPSDRVRAGELMAAMGRYLWAGGETERALDAHEAALLLVPEEPPSPARAEVVAAHAAALMHASRYRESLACAEEALRIARAVGARAQEGHALATAGVDLAQLDDDAAGVARLREALEIADEVGLPEDVGRAYLGLAELLAGPLNRVDEAVAVALRGARRAAALGLERTYGVSLESVAANGLFRLGRWDEADDLVDRLLDRNPSGAIAIGLYLARGRLAVGRGRFPEARIALGTAAALCGRAVDPQHTAPLHTLQAGLALWEGRIDDARRAVAEGFDSLGATDEIWLVAPLVWHGLRAEGERADQARARRQTAEAEAAGAAGAALRDRMQRLVAASTGLPRPARQVVDAYVLLCDCELGRARGDRDPATWFAAVEAWDGVGQPYPAAYARFRAAEAILRLSHERERPAALLFASYRVACAMGASPFAAEIERLAARARIDLDAPAPPPPPIGTGNPFHLTRREDEVLRLVAAGQTNAQIAGALFISTKTASVHVSNILAKLGVSTRVEAAAVAFRLGLDQPA